MNPPRPPVRQKYRKESPRYSVPIARYPFPGPVRNLAPLVATLKLTSGELNRHAEEPTAEAVGAIAIEPPSMSTAESTTIEAWRLSFTRSPPEISDFMTSW